MKKLSKDEQIARLTEELETLRRIFLLLPGNVSWIDAEGYGRGCNYNMIEMLNLSSPEDFVGLKVSDMVDADAANEVLNNNKDVMRANREAALEESFVDEQGIERTFLSQKTPFHNDDNKLLGILCVSFEISERKRMENNLRIAKKKALAASRAKSQFLAMVSHELRIPLTSILGFANFLEQDKLSPKKRKEYIKNIIDSGGYLLSLINNILDFSSLDTNKTDISYNYINLKLLADEVMAMLRATAEPKNLPLILNFDSSIPENIIADGRAFRQIFVNLLGNAIKFTHKGQIELTIQTVKQTNEKVTLYFEVKDTGVGIPANQQKKIFNSFYQLGNVYTRDAHMMGTGLGLAIVKKLVSKLGGKIGVKSTVGEGSRFFFTAEFQIATSQDFSNLEVTQTKRELPVKKVSRTKPEIKNALLVEDNQLVQIIHKRMIEELGYHVDVVDRADKALLMLEQHDYDIAFVDIGLPDMDGFALIKQIRKKSEHSCREDLVILALTGYSDKETRKRCLRAGADTVLVKPVSVPTLKEAVLQLI